MINRRNLVKAFVLSVLAAVASLVIRIAAATKVLKQDPNLDWDAVNQMPYAEALDYIQAHTTEVSGVSLYLEYLENPIHIWDSLLGLSYWALGFFICFIILLAWVDRGAAT